MMPPLGDHFDKRTALSVLYFLHYAYFHIWSIRKFSRSVSTMNSQKVIWLEKLWPFGMVSMSFVLRHETDGRFQSTIALSILWTRRGGWVWYWDITSQWRDNSASTDGGFQFFKSVTKSICTYFSLVFLQFQKVGGMFLLHFWGFFIAALSEKTCKKSDMVSMTICLAANGGKFQIRASIHLDFSTIVPSAPQVLTILNEVTTLCRINFFILFKNQVNLI